MRYIFTVLFLTFFLNCKCQTLYIDSSNGLQYSLINTPLKVNFYDTFLTNRMYIQRIEGNGIIDSTGFMDFYYLLMDNNHNQSMMGYVRLANSEYISFLTAFCEGNKSYAFFSVASKIGLVLR